MAKVYQIDCRQLGVDCEFSTQADTIEDVIEQCAEHGRTEHGMKSFGPELFGKMRACVTQVEVPA